MVWAHRSARACAAPGRVACDGLSGAAAPRGLGRAQAWGRPTRPCCVALHPKWAHQANSNCVRALAACPEPRTDAHTRCLLVRSPTPAPCPPPPLGASVCACRLASPRPNVQQLSMRRPTPSQRPACDVHHTPSDVQCASPTVWLPTTVRGLACAGSSQQAPCCCLLTTEPGPGGASCMRAAGPAGTGPAGMIAAVPAGAAHGLSAWQQRPLGLLLRMRGCVSAATTTLQAAWLHTAG